MEEQGITIEELARAVAEQFGAERFAVTEDSFREILFIRIEGLSKFSEEEVEKRAAPLLDEIESDYEEIILVDL
ncbi:MAG: hypothetical protein LAT75_06870 [Candidatus Cyclonatronum sp.]|uniref:hypothetical protein n=1 Tax=Cyclonatronum sp. TaxID=3024185 RepID=UPI0025BF15E0|nr:hypothetical protein [Cyclonatronum sp.]MCC5933353.1 hypothetical protein [Balneolales bacterium]MCH8486570.1 hypothetical protein [Cyclonatronum sp.]